MGESGTKLQVTGDSGVGSCLDYTTKASAYSIPTNEEINGKDNFSGHYSGPTMTPVNNPVLHSYPSQCQPQEYFNMRSFDAALSDVIFQGYGNTSDQQCVPIPLQYPNQVMYHMPQIHQFSGHSNVPPPPASQLSYYAAIQAQLQHAYMMRQNISSALLSNMNVANCSYRNPTFNGQAQPLSFFLNPGQYPTNNQARSGNQSVGTPFSKGVFSESAHTNFDHPSGLVANTQSRYKTAVHQVQPVAVRGPPRKPRQSGHAIWIGNLPPHTDIMSLVLHVCKEVKGLESLFLISKSNCAFANFKDEEACTAAQLKIHDSRFQTVRLVSRLRRGSNSINTGTHVPNGRSVSEKSTSPTIASTPSSGGVLKTNEVEDRTGAIPESKTEIKSSPIDKFFVVKSLTVEDLELSVKSGIWATQSHNEKVFNEAFKTSDNVFLIFSANKSGEYFGYARMVSPINDDPAAAIEFAPMAQSVGDPVLAKTILSPESRFTPKGRIIDDSARGTIFWEVDRDHEGEDDEIEEVESDKSLPEEPSAKAWGKPFRVEWISTIRLPFHVTRGLRNPWNSNREVKIARDGTELETTVGRKLIELFHRISSPLQPPIPGVTQRLMVEYQQPHHY